MQLEEFEKEVSVLDQEPSHIEDDSSQRHQEFVAVIRNQLSSIRNELIFSKDERDSKVLPKLTVVGQERDELASFLSGSIIVTNSSAVDTSTNCIKADMGFNDITKSCSLSSNVPVINCQKEVISESLDDYSSQHGTHISRDTNELCTAAELSTLKGSSAVMHDARIDIGTNDCTTHSATDLSLRDCYDSIGLCVDRGRTNGHHRNASNSGLSTCQERLTGHYRASSVGSSMSYENDSVATCRTIDRRAASMLPWNIWSFLRKSDRIVGSGVPQSVVKRWKDGEGDPLDLCEMCDGDMEASCSALCYDSKRMKECSELFNALRRSQELAPVRHILQRITIALAAIVLLWLYLY
ncbi:hypothetical protein KP509_17G003800 [Ceratopteris richardii]|uniref:Uncharacterized protein n=1 Tax=Ceratopteris richardii TaxID=49495 RepID=A0A8T2SWF1_CERRI|nr:hypothetical protein KP509_17G003800 [Ceratopteris richardii]